MIVKQGTKILVILLQFLSSGTIAYGQEIQWLGDYQEAQSQALAQNKIILVRFMVDIDEVHQRMERMSQT